MIQARLLSDWVADIDGINLQLAFEAFDVPVPDRLCQAVEFASLDSSVDSKNLSGVGQFDQVRGDIDDVADSRVFLSLFGSDRTDNRGACGNADTDTQRFTVGWTQVAAAAQDILTGISGAR